MVYEQPLVVGRFLRRYKRFFADVEVDGWSWTAPRLARAFRHLAAGAGRLWLRACWTRLISESTLSWRPAEGEPRRQLIVAEARVISAGTLNDREAPAAPPGWERTQGERCDALDRTGHDRLRVLTAEIRRIARNGEDPRLHLGPGQVLSGERLARLLEEA